MTTDTLSLWTKVAESWPSVVLAMNCDRDRLDGFPYRRGYFRNIITGKEKDQSLKSFKIGKHLAILRDDLVVWLAKRTAYEGWAMNETQNPTSPKVGLHTKTDAEQSDNKQLCSKSQGVEEPIHFSVFQSDKQLSKTFSLVDGKLEKGRGGAIVSGKVRTVEADSIQAVMEELAAIGSNGAAAYGHCAHERANIRTKKSYESIKANGGVLFQNGVPIISRTRVFFSYPAGPALLLIDCDDKAISKADLIESLVKLCPELADTPMLYRPSVSSHLSHPQHGSLTGVNGHRLLILVASGTDIPRAAKVLYNRSWVGGHDFIFISEAGSMEARSRLLDMKVFQPERLDFVGGAVLKDGITQSLPPWEIINPEGTPLDTIQTLPDDLDVAERVKELILVAKADAEPRARDVKEAWVFEKLAEALARVPDATEDQKIALEKTFSSAVFDSLLLGDFLILLESGDWVTVGVILDDPKKFHNTRCADPLEPDYRDDHRIAWINLRGTGRPIIYSHAHGGCRFVLHRARQTIELLDGERINSTAKAIEIMQARGALYKKGNELVSLTADGKMTFLRHEHVLALLDTHCRFEKYDRRLQKNVPKDAQPELAKTVLSANWLWDEIPPLKAISFQPVYDPINDRLIDKDGYDTATGLMLILPELEGWQGIPGHIEPDVELIETLWTPFKDFPFVSNTDRGTMLAAILTATTRPVLPTAPAIATDSPVMGSGKGKIATCLSVLAGENDPAAIPISSETEELRKMLFSAYRAGKPVVWLDNLEGYLYSPALCAYLTSPTMADRVLGKTDLQQVESNLLLLLTGNNITLKGDLTRRIFKVRIDPQMADPWTREFDVDPFQYCKDHKLEMLRAAFMLLRGAQQHGPKPKGRLASFEVWSDTVRRAVLWADELTNGNMFADPVGAISDAVELNPDTAKLRDLLNVWPPDAERGLTVKELIEKAKIDHKFAAMDSDLWFALEVVAGQRGDINPNMLAAYLRKNEDRIIDGKKIKRAGKYSGAVQWCVLSGVELYQF